jgi:hypothetical protein
MSEPVDPIRDQAERRLMQRRSAERRKPEPGTALILAPNPPPEAAEQAPSDPGAEAAYTAQVLGQTGQKRGLKGGPPVLEQARSAYLEAAYSGPLDRRPPPGRVTRTRI